MRYLCVEGNLARSPTSIAKQPSGLGVKDCVVLVVDDNEITRRSMVDLLSTSGMKVVERPSPIGATRVILSKNITVVVIDLLMPGIRGDRLAALFRGNPRLASLGVVLVSGEAESDLRRIGDEVGADAIVSKTKLEELVPAVLKARQRAMARTV